LSWYNAAAGGRADRSGSIPPIIPRQPHGSARSFDMPKSGDKKKGTDKNKPKRSIKEKQEAKKEKNRKKGTA
jgi:hypothetical protein